MLPLKIVQPFDILLILFYACRSLLHLALIFSCFSNKDHVA